MPSLLASFLIFLFPNPSNIKKFQNLSKSNLYCSISFQKSIYFSLNTNNK
ncbi:hypothetical protein NBO_24g0035 [Nosema bombycis CQ1]|uniref:Uncharacterized protein n=1 Tax=Nosema bombycis (strain CQ1 / CVCC 102059) TaxID=578461 RepID=R0MK26_NOSB1|nr:hypothetical protein NBO_24g0035 [Nosema bombycis CQ1]|eukprot:EOB14590.1 hypothetical protein NBO_24g0035 [Nosema bombycis CQ1]